jgi:RNA polymerase sigma-B factor
MTTDPTALFEEYRRTGSRSLRNRIVEEHMGLAIHIARGFENRSRRDRDIEQVAMLGLVKAVDRYDVTLGVPFTSFAGRTIEGEIKRYFRDSTWAVKVPRGAKELNVAVRRAIDQLSVSSGRSPTVDEVASHLGVDREDVVTGLAADPARSVGTLDPGPGDEDDGRGDRSRAVASVERGFGDIDDQRTVEKLLMTLPERERRIVELRFFHDMSQSEIAEDVGLSQMHVSRLLRASLERMRASEEVD